MMTRSHLQPPAEVGDEMSGSAEVRSVHGLSVPSRTELTSKFVIRHGEKVALLDEESW